MVPTRSWSSLFKVRYQLLNNGVYLSQWNDSLLFLFLKVEALKRQKASYRGSLGKLFCTICIVNRTTYSGKN